MFLSFSCSSPLCSSHTLECTNSRFQCKLRFNVQTLRRKAWPCKVWFKQWRRSYQVHQRQRAQRRKEKNADNKAMKRSTRLSQSLQRCPDKDCTPPGEAWPGVACIRVYGSTQTRRIAFRGCQACPRQEHAHILENCKQTVHNFHIAFSSHCIWHMTRAEREQNLDG